MKRILVVGGGVYQVPLIKRIRVLGYEAYCVDRNENAPGFKEAHGYRCVDILDEKECLAYAQALNIDGVATYGATITLPTVSYIGENLRLPTLTMDTARIACNKYRIKKALVDGGCNSKGKLIVFHNEKETLNDKPEFPCVIKPSDGSGSKGVSIVKEEQQYESAVREGFASARFGEIYSEQYIEGDEYSVEAFVHNGKAYIYAIVKTTFERHDHSNTGIEYGHKTPPGIDEGKEQKIKREIEKAISILSINMGSVNFDVILSKEDGRAYIIDCGIRIGQNLIGSHIVPLSRGVSEMDMYISQVLSLEISPEPKYHKNIATRLLIAEPGVIKEILPMDKYIGKNSIVDIVLRKKAGDIQRTYTDKSDNCGWVICDGVNPEEAEQNAEKARIMLLPNIITK